MNSATAMSAALVAPQKTNVPFRERKPGFRNGCSMKRQDKAPRMRLASNRWIPFGAFSKLLYLAKEITGQCQR